MTMEEYKDFLGRGWSFPPTFNRNTGTVELSSAEDNIRENIGIILSTSPGERIMHPGFGCDLSGLMFEEITQTLKRKIRTMISDALLLQEPRIAVDSINVKEDEKRDGLLMINIGYTVRSTNSRRNMVYPFYLFEN